MNQRRRGIRKRWGDFRANMKRKANAATADQWAEGAGRDAVRKVGGLGGGGKLMDSVRGSMAMGLGATAGAIFGGRAGVGLAKSVVHPWAKNAVIGATWGAGGLAGSTAGRMAEAASLRRRHRDHSRKLGLKAPSQWKLVRDGIFRDPVIEVATLATPSASVSAGMDPRLDTGIQPAYERWAVRELMAGRGKKKLRTKVREARRRAMYRAGVRKGKE